MYAEGLNAFSYMLVYSWHAFKSYLQIVTAGIMYSIKESVVQYAGHSLWIPKNVGMNIVKCMMCI